MLVTDQENAMQAIVQHEYGSPEVLTLQEVDKPVVKDDEVLIKVRAACVNPIDWHFLLGKPYLIRMLSGLRKPKNRVRGMDVAGTVEAVGKNVTQLQVGDAVFGWCQGAFAEYACAKEKKLALKPSKFTFAQAATIPIAAVTALQALRDKGQLQSGQKVVINGASGGVGTFAVQIAKSFGADVTGVCSTRNVKLVQSIAADQVIDYTKEDFTENEQTYDLILDNVGNHPLPAFKRALSPKGSYVSIGVKSQGNWVAPLMQGSKIFLTSLRSSQKFHSILEKQTKEDLLVLKELLENGKVIPVIDKTYPMDKTPEAIEYLLEGHAQGKVVITM